MNTHAHATSMSISERLSQLNLIYEIDHQEHLTIDKYVVFY
jgi:hypothetical protein